MFVKAKKWIKALSPKFLVILPSIFLILYFHGNAIGAVLHVSGDIGTSGNGTTWSEAFLTIQEAVDAASVGDEIWIKKGVYTISAQITINKEVNIYGGFDGMEAERNDRDWAENVTAIDGQNTTRCFYITSNPTIDGFTVTKGDANGSSFPDNSGGGIYNDQASPSIRNCTFSENNADSDGGGIFNNESSPSITNCTFNLNMAVIGGGVRNMFHSSPVITNCTFSENFAIINGGGIFNCTSTPFIKDCLITKNSVEVNGGGVFNINSNSILVNCIISENNAEWGGGMYNFESDPVLTNCTFYGNKALSGGGGMLNDELSSPSVTNCILWNDTAPDGPEIRNSGNPVVTFCDIQGGYQGNGNIDSDPLFVSNPDFHLQETSPCIDTGNNNAPDLPDNDFEGNSRIIDGDRDGTATVDIGAFEYKPTVVADGDVAPLGSRDGIVNVGDALVALRFALNLETPTQEDVDHGDVAPLDASNQPNPDGHITVGDALVILRKALNIIIF